MADRNWQKGYQGGNTLSGMTVTYMEGIEADLKSLSARISQLENPTQSGSTATVSSLNPNSVAAGNMVSVIVDGSGFLPTSAIEIVGQGPPQGGTSYISANQLQTNYLFPSTKGTYQVGVRNPGEALSNTKPFTVT